MKRLFAELNISYGQKVLLLTTLPLLLAFSAVALLTLNQSRQISEGEIKFLETQLIEAKKAELRNYVTQAKNGFYFIYGNAAPDDVDAKQWVAQILAAMIYGKDGFFFAYDYDGTNIVSRRQADVINTLSPDVVLLDLNMPVMGGLPATEMILEKRPQTRILILSMHDSAEYIATALSHGALGYILKDVPTDIIKQAIDSVMSGDRFLCPGAQVSLNPTGMPDRQALTSREQTILLQLAQGNSNRQVAEALEISVRTVETHRKNIKQKLGISSTAGLMRYAMEHGVLQGTGVVMRGKPGSPKSACLVSPAWSPLLASRLHSSGPRRATGCYPMTAEPESYATTDRRLTESDTSG